jgi:hypothetical protein
VADTWNNRIQRFTADGVFVLEWGRHGHAASQFGHPLGIAVDGSGHAYVTDTENHRIQVFAPAHPPPDPEYGLALNGSFQASPDLLHWAYGGDLPVSLIHADGQDNLTARLGEPVLAQAQPKGTAWLRQTIYVPPVWARPELSFRYRIYANDILDYSDFYVWLGRENGAQLALVLRDGHPGPQAPLPATDSGWRETTYDLSAFRGQNVRLVFEARNLHDNRSWGIWTFLDDVRVVDAGP